MTSRSQRKTSSLGPTSSRSSRSVRRQAVAPASTTLAAQDEATIRRLVGHHLARARGEAGAAAALRKYTWAVGARGRKEVVGLVARALAFDGGRFLRRAAVDLSAADAADVAYAFVRLAIEHNVTSTAALTLLLRSAMQSVAVDGALMRIVAGKHTPEDEARVVRLDASARLNVAEGLRHAQNASTGGGSAGPDFAGAMAQLEASRARRLAEAAPPAAITPTETASQIDLTDDEPDEPNPFRRPQDARVSSPVPTAIDVAADAPTPRAVAARRGINVSVKEH